jgi:hypothetical protein
VQALELRPQRAEVRAALELGLHLAQVTLQVLRLESRLRFGHSED